MLRATSWLALGVFRTLMLLTSEPRGLIATSRIPSLPLSQSLKPSSVPSWPRPSMSTRPISCAVSSELG